MIYGYVRVSTDKQRVDNQEYEIIRFCTKNKISIDEWIKETISGTKTPDKRKLGGLLNKVKTGDLIICSELSRLGRSLFMIMKILNNLMEIGAKVWTIKDNYRLGDDIQSKVLAFAFGLSAEIERNLISQRTKEALTLKMAEGIIIGRPRGSKNIKTKLSPRIKEVKSLLRQGHSYSKIGMIMKVHRNTVIKFCAENDLAKYCVYAMTDKRALSKKQLKKAQEEIGFAQMKKEINSGLSYEEIGKRYKMSGVAVRGYVQSNEVLYKLYKDYHTKMLNTVTSRGAGGIVSPFVFNIGQTSAKDRARSVDEPLSTVVTKAEHCLVEQVYLDIHFRMLKNHELKQAQGFEKEYILKGNTTEQTKQIGNAVPPPLGKALASVAMSAWRT